MKHLFFLLMVFAMTSCGFASQPAPPLPTKPSDWLDGQPLGWNQLKGNVVLLNVWTFQCWNSYRSLPWLVSLNQKYPHLKIIGIHSPEFEHEKDRNKLRSTMANYKVTYPQLLDDEFHYWRQLNNSYWPAFYLVDKQGQIRGRFAGETHANDSQAKKIEQLIDALSRE